MNKAFPGLGLPANHFKGIGAVYFDWGLSTEVRIGVTKGGVTFNDGAVFTKREADGDIMPVKGATDLTALNPQLTINTLRIDVQAVLKYFAGLKADAIAAGVQKLYRQLDLSSSYITNVAWVGQDSKGNNIAVVLENCLGDQALNLSAADKTAKLVLPIVFTCYADPATFDPDDETTWPYWLEFPVSNVTFTVTDDATPTPAAIEGATVKLSDGQTGLTNASGVATFEVTYGDITFTISATGKVTADGDLTVDGATEAVTQELVAI